MFRKILEKVNLSKLIVLFVPSFSYFFYSYLSQLSVCLRFAKGLLYCTNLGVCLYVVYVCMCVVNMVCVFVWYMYVVWCMMYVDHTCVSTHIVMCMHEIERSQIGEEWLQLKPYMSLRRYRKQNFGITLQLLGPTSSKPENFLHKNMLSHTIS